MGFLTADRAALDALLPGLDDALARAGLAALESGGVGIDAFRQSGGPGLLVPEDLRGLGADPLAAARAQRAIGSRSPSLAVATTMHHFSVATLVEMVSGGLETILIEAIARENLLVASGFAEAVPGQSILTPGLTGRRSGDGLVLNGTKKPCSLGESMDLLTVSVEVDGQLAVVLVPPKLPGVERRPFWQNPALAAAQSCEVVLRDVEVPAKLVSYSAADDRLDDVQVAGFLWFELLICASYVGIASGLVERALERPDLPATEVAAAVAGVEAAMAAVEGMCPLVAGPERGAAQLGRVLAVRYGLQELVFRAAGQAAELLGGRAFASSAAVTLLLASSRALAFHPPSRAGTAPGLVAWAGGGRLRIG
jgi:hypothetical protein